MKFLFSFLLLFMFHQAATAANCSPVNLITDLNSPFSKIPVYDQKDSNICYAFAASQMVDYHLIKNGAQKRSVHPAWLALNYALGRNRKGLDIGHTKDAIERLAEVQNCDFDIVSQSLKNWAGLNISEARIVAFIEKYANSGRSPAQVSEFTQKMSEELKKLNLNPVEVVSKILLPACESRQSVNVPKVAKYNYAQLPDDQAFESFMVERIGQDPTPYSIAYCSKVWKDPDYDGIDLTFFGKRDALKKDCEYHESLIVGRKPVGNSCHLLVRNTWGDSWKATNKDWKCLCKNKKTGAFVDDCDSINHPSHQYSVEACWISSEKISRNTGVVTFLNPL